MEHTINSKLSLVPLHIRLDKKNFIVEDEATGDFFEMPRICIDAIELIQAGKTIGEVEKQLLNVYTAEEVDMEGFVEQLVEFGLVNEIDGKVILEEKKRNATRGFEWITPKFARLFFNKVTDKWYVFLFLLNIMLFAFHPELLPRYRDIFIVDSAVLSIILYMVMSLVFIIIHELGHVFAIRSYGLPTKLSIGRRLFLIVFETDLTSAWKLSPRERNTLYLAGMAFEQVILTTAILLSLFLGDIHWLSGLLGVVIFDIAIKTIYQCCFYMKTDLYYVIENLTGCYNLMEGAQQHLSKWIPFLKPKERTETFQTEKIIIYVYSIFYLLGIIITLALFTTLLL